MGIIVVVVVVVRLRAGKFKQREIEGWSAGRRLLSMALGRADGVLIACCSRSLLFTLPFLLASHPPLLTATVLACARTPTVLTLQLIVGTSWFSGRVGLIAFHASPTLTRPGIPKPPRPGRVCVGAPTRRLPLGCIIASRAGCGRYTTPGCKPAPLTRSGVSLAGAYQVLGYQPASRSLGYWPVLYSLG